MKDLRSEAIDTSLLKFNSDDREYTFIETPSYWDSVRNIILGISTIQVAILVISASIDEFETGMSKEGQTREHVNFAFTLSIKEILVAKIDCIYLWNEVNTSFWQKCNLGFQTSSFFSRK